MLDIVIDLINRKRKRGPDQQRSGPRSALAILPPLFEYALAETLDNAFREPLSLFSKLVAEVASRLGHTVTFAFDGLLGMMGRLGPSDYEKAIPELSELMRSLLG